MPEKYEKFLPEPDYINGSKSKMKEKIAERQNPVNGKRLTTPGLSHLHQKNSKWGRSEESKMKDLGVRTPVCIVE